MYKRKPFRSNYYSQVILWNNINMSPKAILVFCAQALLAQSALSVCAGGIRGAGLAGYGLAGGYGVGYGAGCGCGGVASTGGGLPIASASPVAPVGVSVHSENAYEGTLCAGGNLPFLGTVGIEGVLPTAGAGAVSYGCGDGAIGIASEGPIGTGIVSGNTFAPSAGLINQGIGYAGNGLGYAGNGLGYGYGHGVGIAGYGARGCGCGCGARI